MNILGLSGRLTAALVVCAAGAWGSVIFDGGTPGAPLGGPELTSNEVAASFTLLGQASVTGFDFWSVDFQPPAFEGFSGTLLWTIFQDDNGKPGSPVAFLPAGISQRTVVQTDTILKYPVTVYQNTVTLTPSTLNPGTYWLGLRNAASVSGFDGFLWAETDGSFMSTLAAQSESATLTASGWVDSGLSLSFRINGTQTREPIAAPEPSTLLLAGGGLLLSAARRIRL
jgi:hypothetical protein